MHKTYAKKYFLINLKKLSLGQIEILYRKLTQNFLFNIYAISDDIDVFVAFETMNNRGKPLSHLELLKNRLIYLSTKFSAENFEKQKLRNAINDGWKSIYHYLGRNKAKILDDDIFLGNHCALYFGEDIRSNVGKYEKTRSPGYWPRHSMYGEYLLEGVFTPKNIGTLSSDIASKDELTIEKIYNYVQSLKDSVEVWYYILNPLHSNFCEDEKLWLEKLNRQPIPIPLSIAPLIMIFYQNEQNEQVKVHFLKTLERYLFIVALTRYAYTPDFERTNLHGLAIKFKNGEISSEKLIRAIEEPIDTFIGKKESIEQIAYNMKNNSGFYGWFGLKYFLYEYELSLKRRSKTFREKLNWDKFIENDPMDEEDKRDHYTIEHIYPQKPRKSCWIEKFKQYTDKERRALKNSLGNLVPLSEPKNQALEDECFEKKKGTPNSMIGYKYGSYSENQVANYTEWTAKEILEQGLKMIDFWEKRWNFNFGDKRDKAKFLHIEFVIEKENISLE